MGSESVCSVALGLSILFLLAAMYAEGKP